MHYLTDFAAASTILRGDMDILDQVLVLDDHTYDDSQHNFSRARYAAHSAVAFTANVRPTSPRCRCPGGSRASCDVKPVFGPISIAFVGFDRPARRETNFSRLRVARRQVAGLLGSAGCAASVDVAEGGRDARDRKSTRLNSSH